jgi:hypothetical protein
MSTDEPPTKDAAKAKRAQYTANEAAEDAATNSRVARAQVHDRYVVRLKQIRATRTAEGVRLMFLSNDPTAKDARAIVARRTIEEDDKHKAYSVDGRAQVTLQDALVEQLKKLGPLPDDPPFAADHRLADLLETLGAEGVDQARRLRKASKDREATGKAPKVWRFERVTARATLLDDKLFPGSQFDDLQVIDPAGYVPNSTGVEHDPAEVSSSIVVLEDEWSLDFTAMPVAIRMLAHATWIDVVLPRLGNPAALARAVCTDVLDLYSQRFERKERNGQTALSLQTDRWILVPAVEAPIAAILHRGVELLASEAGIDLLEWQVTEAHRRFQRNESDFRNLRVEGGWSALAHDHLGLGYKGAPANLRAIVMAQAHLRFEAWGIRGNLLSYTEPSSHAPGRRSVVTMTLGDMLLAGFASAMRNEKDNSLSAREGRQLVPILGKVALVGRGNDFAAQRRMVWRFAVALRARASELAQNGAVEMLLDAWATIAGEAGLPRSPDLLARVLGAWETGSDKTQPLIVRSDNGRRVTLHESRKDALDFMVRGWKLSERGRDAGKAGAAGRLQKRKPTPKPSGE